MDSTIDDIKRKIDIVEYINALVPLKKAGRTYKACCPFHSEKTPSFTVSPDRQIWRCFGACQEGGDVISFLMKWENITFYEALKELAHLTGVKLENTHIEDRSWKEKDLLLQINTLAAKYYSYIFQSHPAGEQARLYAHERGMTDALNNTFRIGYAPDTWDSLVTFLKRKGFKEVDIERAGLILQSSKDPQRYYDRFRGRLMFPIIDARQNILGFSGRLLTKDDKQAKYMNTPETPLYRKRETLFGMHVAHEAIRTSKVAIIVEGEFDMISCFKHGISNAVAIKGSAFTKDQLMLLKRYTKHLILALDADFSGTQTTLKAIKDAEDMDFRIDIIRYEFAKDPDEALQKDPIAFKKLLKKPTHIYDFILETALTRHGADTSLDAYQKKEIVDDIVPFLSGIGNSIIRSHYIKRLAQAIHAEVRDIEASIRAYSKTGKTPPLPQQKTQESKVNRYEGLQKHILAKILQSDIPLRIIDSMKKHVSPTDFTIPSYADIVQALFAYSQTEFHLDIFSQALPAALNAVIDELCLYDIAADKEDSAEEEILKSAQKAILDLKKLSLKHQLTSANVTDPHQLQEIAQNLARIEKELRVM